jgi:hypothetical protein
VVVFGGEGTLERSGKGAPPPKPRWAGASGVGGGWLSFATASLETVAVAVHLQDVDVMGDALEQCAGAPFRTEDLGPFFEGAGRCSKVSMRGRSID